MKLNTRAFALAAGISAAATYTVCAFFVAIAPAATTSFASAVTHLDLTGLSRPITWGIYLEGLVFWSLWATALFALAGWVYNRLTPGKTGAEALARPVTQHV